MIQDIETIELRTPSKPTYTIVRNGSTLGVRYPRGTVHWFDQWRDSRQPRSTVEEVKLSGLWPVQEGVQ